MCQDKRVDEAEPLPGYGVSEASTATEAANAFEKGHAAGVQFSRNRMIRSPFEFDIEHVFSYHAPEAWQIPQYETIRSAAKLLALVIEQNTPACADRMNAINQLRVAVMMANAAIATGGRLTR